jgi:chloramphenicol 3-O phosphotransferase
MPVSSHKIAGASDDKLRRHALNTTARIVFLNGVGCSGKSSIAKALQAITAQPFLHIQMDAFLDMLPEALQNHPDGFAYETVRQDGKSSVVIRGGAVGQRLMRGMRHAIAAMAGQGNNLVVDEVMRRSEWLEYAALLSAFQVWLVGIFAPLDVLEARERGRGDRMIGLARWQYDRVHRDMKYDLEIDTSGAPPSECAHLIRQKFRL